MTQPWRRTSDRPLGLGGERPVWWEGRIWIDVRGQRWRAIFNGNGVEDNPAKNKLWVLQHETEEEADARGNR